MYNANEETVKATKNNVMFLQDVEQHEYIIPEGIIFFRTSRCKINRLVLSKEVLDVKCDSCGLLEIILNEKVLSLDCSNNNLSGTLIVKHRMHKFHCNNNNIKNLVFKCTPAILSCNNNIIGNLTFNKTSPSIISCYGNELTRNKDIEISYTKPLNYTSIAYNMRTGRYPSKRKYMCISCNSFVSSDLIYTKTRKNVTGYTTKTRICIKCFRRMIF
ncbi:MAG: hypothetical protein COA94_08310 [Rickettsiales bacterium]|nr:MAG: hypothetical protein COA94_08310 [Rickettsiales bacterium]